MLRYMQDHPETLKMFGNEDPQLGEAIEYVEENGLKIYGFAVIASKDKILELAEAETFLMSIPDCTSK